LSDDIGSETGTSKTTVAFAVIFPGWWTPVFAGGFGKNGLQNMVF
jgi:hypothetical protein